MGDEAADNLVGQPNLAALSVANAGMSEMGLLKLLAVPRLRRLTVGDDVALETVLKLRARIACFVKNS